MFYLIGCFLKKTVMYLAPLLLCITAASLSGGDGDGPSADKASGLTVEVPGSLTDPEYTYSFVDYEKLFALWRESIEKDLDNGRNLGGDNEALEYLQRYADKHTEFLLKILQKDNDHMLFVDMYFFRGVLDIPCYTPLVKKYSFYFSLDDNSPSFPNSVEKRRWRENSLVIHLRNKVFAMDTIAPTNRKGGEARQGRSGEGEAVVGIFGATCRGEH